MTDPQPTATVAGRSVDLRVTGYPDVDNRWGPGSIRPAGARIEYRGTLIRGHVGGLWVHPSGEVTDAPLEQYYDAPDGDLSDWPDGLAGLAREHAVPPVSRAAVLEEAANLAETVAESLRAHHEFERSTGALDVMTELRRMAADARQECALCGHLTCTGGKSCGVVLTSAGDDNSLPCPCTGAEAPEPAAQAEAYPPEHTWAAELYDPIAKEWAPGTRYIDRDRAVNALAHGKRLGPAWKDGTPTERRLVRATTTYTVELPAAVPAVGQTDEEAP